MFSVFILKQCHATLENVSIIKGQIIVMFNCLCIISVHYDQVESAPASIFHTVFLLWLLSLCIIIIIIIITDFTNDDDALMHIEEYTINYS